jgi:hypothetical protein
MKTLILASVIFTAGLFQTRSSTIETGSVSSLGTDFFLNTAATMGGDANATTANFIRDFGSFDAGPFSLVSITGLAWASKGTGTTAGYARATFTFLGADNAVGGGDDVLIGTVADTLNFSGAGVYIWSFDTALANTITPNDFGINDFQITIEGFTDATETTAAPIYYKTTAGSSLASVKLSVAGEALAVPEPSTFALGGLAGAGLLFLRRRQ